MVDQQGRDALLAVLSGLTERHRTALVHITHYNNEAEAADRTINLSRSRGDNTDDGRDGAPRRPPRRRWATTRGAPVLELDGVGHEYGSGTPWAKTALRDISFVGARGRRCADPRRQRVRQVDAGVDHGRADRRRPTGTCLLDGEPADEQVGAVAISFQAARLQLMRSRVDLEVASAAGLFAYDDHGRVVDGAGRRRAGCRAGAAAHRPAQRRSDAPRGAGRVCWRAQPRALILDEPLAGLDAASQRGLLRLLADLRRNAGLTVVVISHDFAGLEELCPRILHLRDGVHGARVADRAGGLS